jgi:hypothetical protein
MSSVVPLPAGLVTWNVPAERLDAVAEPDQSGPLGRVGSPDPVVADRQPRDRVACAELDVHDGCVREIEPDDDAFG